MSESESPEVLPLSGIPHEHCHASKEELREEGHRLDDDCPACLLVRTRCPVAFHPTAAYLAQAIAPPAAWVINTAPVRVLGDASGPHSTAIIVGRKTVVACAHSLGFVIDGSQRNTKSKVHYQYIDEYWIQPSFTKNARREYTTDGRIPITLAKFHVENDWALFIRADGNLFDESEVAIIDTSPAVNPGNVLSHEDAVVLHCPVSMKSGITFAKEFSVGCHRSGVRIQTQSSHHVMYEGHDLCRGSSGGGVYVFPNSSVLGLHSELITEAEFDEDADTKVMAQTDKRVLSEDPPYDVFENDGSDPPAKKPKQVSSESVFSGLAGGNNGNGRALILCKFPRLMYYIEELDK